MDKYILLKAKVIGREEGGKVLTVRLVDGFGDAQCVVHEDAIVPAK